MRKLLILAAVVIVIFGVGSVVSRTVLQHAATNNTDTPIFLPSYILDTSKADDLFVLADNAHLTANSVVQADAAVVGRESIIVDGQIDGELTAMGGDIRLGQNSHVSGAASLIGNRITLAGVIQGDLSVVADTLVILPDAQLNGVLELCTSHVTNESALELSTRSCSASELATWQSLRDGTLAQQAISGGGFSLASFLITGLIALALAAFSGLIVTIFPRPFGYMTQAIRNVPARVTRIGCFTQLLVVALLVLLGVIIAVLPPLGLVLLPILALLLLPFLVLCAVGWMTMALLTGDWLLRRFARRTSLPMLTMICGALGLFLMWTVLTILPFGPIFGLLMPILVATVGLGAAIMTRVGTRSPARSYFVQG